MILIISSLLETVGKLVWLFEHCDRDMLVRYGMSHSSALFFVCAPLFFFIDSPFLCLLNISHECRQSITLVSFVSGRCEIAIQDFHSVGRSFVDDLPI